jgi:DNA-binding transcriptional ArsR family regulator
MPDPKAEIDRIFHALGDPTRRAILEALSERPQSVSALASPLGLTLAAVVQHVQLLEEARLVASEKVGRTRTCKIEPQGIALASRWLEERRSLWDKRLDRLGEFLAEDEE